MSDSYVQIGVTTLRDPVTGHELTDVPLYVRADKNADLRGGFTKMVMDRAMGLKSSGPQPAPEAGEGDG